MIICFSGTGNSLKCALVLKEALPVNWQSLTMISSQNLASPSVTLAAAPDEPVIWIFPTYSWGVPPIVLRFLEICTCTRPDALHHAVVTYGDDAGNLASQWHRRLQRKNLRRLFRNHAQHLHPDERLRYRPFRHRKGKTCRHTRPDSRNSKSDKGRQHTYRHHCREAPLDKDSNNLPVFYKDVHVTASVPPHYKLCRLRTLCTFMSAVQHKDGSRPAALGQQLCPVPALLPYMPPPRSGLRKSHKRQGTIPVS